MASSTSFKKICPMPARRAGNRAHQSASQRLCARMPASRCSYSSGFGGSGEEHEAREERRHGVREHDLADDAIGFELRVAKLVVPVPHAAISPQVGERIAVL